MSVYPSQKTIGQGSIEFTNSLSLSKKFDSKPQTEGVKSLSRERNISKSRVQDAKCVPLSTLSTLCKPINTISSQERARNTEESTSICLDKHQDFSSRNENMYSEPKSDLLKKKESKLNIDSGRRGSEHETLIENLIEKYIGPKMKTKPGNLNMPKMISTQMTARLNKLNPESKENNSITTREDLEDFNNKFVNKYQISVCGANSLEDSKDPSLINYGSINHPSEEHRKVSTVKNLKKSLNFKFPSRKPNKKILRNSESMMSIKENYNNSLFQKVKNERK